MQLIHELTIDSSRWTPAEPPWPPGAADVFVERRADRQPGRSIRTLPPGGELLHGSLIGRGRMAAELDHSVTDVAVAPDDFAVRQATVDVCERYPPKRGVRILNTGGNHRRPVPHSRFRRPRRAGKSRRERLERMRRPAVVRCITVGVLAGAAGTTALNTVTYLDQVVRGRPPSTLPEQTAGRLAEMAGVDLGARAEHREQGIGGLLGIVTGTGIGAAYGVLRWATARDPGVPAAGIGLGAAATMVGSTPMTAMGLTDPRTWGVAGWLSDLIPHLGYGLVTAYAFRVMTDRCGSRVKTMGRPSGRRPA
ncbi:hypothetical protein [Microbispora bryophytorum]|nr:hypothetical protein [Microbispora camponoti]